LLNHVCKTITKDQIHLPHQISQDTFAKQSNGQTIRSLTQIYNHGDYPVQDIYQFLVDQGLSILPEVHLLQTQYFDPENIVKLAIEAGCNAIASTMVFSIPENMHIRFPLL
jgi:class I fructose-bisphosphate aldolase